MTMQELNVLEVAEVAGGLVADYPQTDLEHRAP
jgi:hypothetical protein